MVVITVGYVAGFIAAALFFARLWAPNILTFILSSILRDTNTAATWTVASRALQSSNWPTLLGSDSVKNHGVRKDIIFLTWSSTLMGALIAIAGIVTPLGLHEAVLVSKPTSSAFRYVLDASPFGYGTPPRSSLPFTRLCGYISSSGFDYTETMSPCPFTDTIMTLVTSSNSSIRPKADFPYGYDLTVPKILSDIYSSGTANDTTVSNYFDIQWRRYQTTADDRNTINNGSKYLVGAFRLMQSMVLEDAVRPVEGLIVDMKSGGIGLRNHTVPPGFEYGVSWEEDILFIEPETACVNTNTTIEYTIAQSPNFTTSIIDVLLTDRGGFANLNHTFPLYNRDAPQTNADLAGRAYKAAWLTNAYTMAYYNVTNLGNATLGKRPFSYVNSHVNKTYQIAVYNDASYYDSLGMDATFDFHLNIGGSIANSSSPADSGPPTNPFGISGADFSGIAISCKSNSGADYANITNIVVNCGIMRGVPRRVDKGGSSIQFDAGSKWSQPLYACATAVKASIKTVSFTYNSTSDPLSLVALNITDVQPKVYATDADVPIWGVEYTGDFFRSSQLSALWGLVSPAYSTHPNVSAIRQPHLYLPGYVTTSSSIATLETENLPGSDFYSGAVGEVYQVGDPVAIYKRFDYTGENNMAMWARWQNLSSSAATASLIPNLIWTDFAAAAVVGTKGVLGPGNTAGETPSTAPKVTPMNKKIRYHWPFAIPALLALACLMLMTLGMLLALIFTRHGVDKMRHNLQRLSPGRLMAGFLYPQQGGMSMESEEWSDRVGKTTIIFECDIPIGIRGVGFELEDLRDERKEKAGPRNGIYERAPSGSVEALNARREDEYEIDLGRGYSAVGR